MEPEVGAMGDWGRSLRQFSGERKAPRGSREKAGVQRARKYLSQKFRPFSQEGSPWEGWCGLT